MFKSKIQPTQNIIDKSNNTIKNHNNNNHKLSYEEIRKIVENKNEKEITANNEEKTFKNKFNIV